jgi:HEAT repeat protein
MKTTRNLLCLLFLFLCLGHAFLTGQEKPENEKEIKKLLELLQNKDPQIRLAAAEKLVDMEVQTTWAFPVLIKALQDNNWKVRCFCFKTLRKSGKKAVPFLCEALHHKDKNIKSFSAGILGQIGAIGRIEADAQPAIPALIKIAEGDEDITHVKSSAIWALGLIGPDAREAIPTLLNLLRNEKLKSYPAEPPFLFFLLTHVQMPKPPVFGKYIINALGDMNAITVLAYLLHDLDENIVLWTLDTIGNTGNAAQAIPALIDMLQQTQNSRIKLETIITLGKRCSESAPAIPVLINASQNADADVRREAVVALGNIGTKAAVSIPYLVKLLNHQDPSTRRHAARSLGCIGKEATIAIPKLTKMLPNESDQVQDVIREAIRAIQQQQEK